MQLFKSNTDQSKNTDSVSVNIVYTLHDWVNRSYLSSNLNQLTIGVCLPMLDMPISLIAAKLNTNPQAIPSDATMKKMLKLTSTRKGIIKIGFFAPVLEECIFRGILLPSSIHGFKKLGMQSDHATWAGIIGSSILFGAGHMKGARYGAFATSVLYSMVAVHYQGSLIPTTTAHITHNAIALTLVKRMTR